MSTMDRRSFLAGLAAAALAAGFASRSGAQGGARRVPLTRLERRVVVIGSGFGGGVAALRLAQAGVPVLVLERGIRWPTGPNAETFPHATHPDERVSWLCSPALTKVALPSPACDPFTGLLERVSGNSLPPMSINARSTVLVGYGVSAGRGRFVYDPRTDDAVLQWPPDGDATAFRHIDTRVRKIAGPASHVLDTTAVDTTTWHPLGGASMGSVCDFDGRVFGHRGLYVLDGALMPGNTAACNPSMTIAAVAERALDQLIAHDVGTVF